MWRSVAAGVLLSALAAAAAAAAQLTPAPNERGRLEEVPPRPHPKEPYVVPRQADGLPDWYGVWSSIGPRNMDPTTHTGDRQPNAPLNVRAKAAYDARMEGFARGEPFGEIGCLPEGAPRIMRSPGYAGIDFIVTRDVTWIVHEYKNEVRRIYTDGRKPPPDLDHTYEGYSTGRWEGDTLVFDTVGLKAGTIDSRGLVHSDRMTLHERLRRVGPELMEDQITMTDPEVFSRPWTVTRQYTLQPTWEIKPFVCEENERNAPGENGRTTVQLQGQK